MRRSTERVLSLVVALALVTPYAVLSYGAEPTAADLDKAQGFYAEGLDLRAAGKHDAARDKFDAAFTLVRTPVIGLDLARELVELGKLAEAFEVVEIISHTPVAPKETVKSTAAREDAAKLATELGKRVPTLKVLVSGVPSGETATISVDGKAGDATRRVNPGTHTVVATVSSRPEAKVEVTVKEGESKEVPLAFEGGKAAIGTPEPTTTKKTSTLTYVGFGLAGVGLVAGSITGILAISKASTVKDACPQPDKCPPDQDSNISSSKTMGNISTISFAVAGVGVALGVIGILTSGKSESSEARKPHVTPFIGIGSVGLTGAF